MSTTQRHYPSNRLKFWPFPKNAGQKWRWAIRVKSARFCQPHGQFPHSIPILKKELCWRNRRPPTGCFISRIDIFLTRSFGSVSLPLRPPYACMVPRSSASFDRSSAEFLQLSVAHENKTRSLIHLLDSDFFWLSPMLLLKSRHHPKPFWPRFIIIFFPIHKSTSINRRLSRRHRHPVRFHLVSLQFGYDSAGWIRRICRHGWN